ncbi:hypothetical protein [Williamsia muralis]|uniref:Uncharacterized protein n=1 Tax=Williamsia marianensis TaxID=85044 RepID=A0ABU4EW56_WILMA|nr:hypothetical protein [Williamsia muralis]MDV7135485.1 hypothetical protein [Williamsia muralis]
MRYANRVLINMATGNVLEGLLVRNRGGTLAVVHASLITSHGEESIALDGRVVIPAGRVDYISKRILTGASLSIHDHQLAKIQYSKPC